MNSPATLGDKIEWCYKELKQLLKTRSTITLGFTAEDVANKDTDSAFTANSDNKYPSQKAIKTAFALKSNKTDIQNNSAVYTTASGTDTYTASVTPALTGYTEGQGFLVKFTNGNTGAATLNINSQGDIDIKKNVSTDVANGDIPAGVIKLLVFDGINFQLI